MSSAFVDNDPHVNLGYRNVNLNNNTNSIICVNDCGKN